MDMPAATASKVNVLTRNHIARFPEIIHLRENSQDIINFAYKFYREKWPQMMEVVHCVSDEFTTLESHRAKLRELVALEKQALEGLEKLIA